jgi:serine phosphatase RsbU (regulator of sigma subunit)
MLVSVVLIYGVVFAERENTISATETELGVATRIQADMLPNTFPFMPERTEFDLYASMDPAKEVGGDFYDFFMVDDDRLALVIADVSGKGIPAALFMMSSKILIKNSVMTGKSPGEVLKIVNNQICENNREEMFVTVWLGILDLTTGQLVSANAGHEYPVLKTPDGDFEILKSKHSFVVGGMKGLKYRETEMTLLPGSKLFVYTDGVPEAEAEGEVQYGYDRFLNTLNSHRDEAPEGLLKAVTKSVADFAQDHPQFDDLTMLCIHYIGKESEVNHEERTDD